VGRHSGQELDSGNAVGVEVRGPERHKEAGKAAFTGGFPPKRDLGQVTVVQILDMFQWDAEAGWQVDRQAGIASPHFRDGVADLV
jgi:hypothetical protein